MILQILDVFLIYNKMKSITHLGNSLTLYFANYLTINLHLYY